MTAKAAKVTNIHGFLDAGMELQNAVMLLGAYIARLDFLCSPLKIIFVAEPKLFNRLEELCKDLHPH